jgi:hypothetical protein
MALTTITGRVRATVRLKGADGGGDRVVSSSWASDRSFPRTMGVAVPFEIEAPDGAVFRVDPFGALVALPVRARGARDGVRHEEAWIAFADELTIEGEVERAARNRQPPALLAHRIAAAGAAPLHRLPPRTLQRGESERVEAVAAAAATSETPAPPPAQSPEGQSPAPSPGGRRRPRSPG